MQAPQNIELAWRYSWYEEISYWRSTVSSLSGTGVVNPDSDLLVHSTARARNACLQGLAFYKTLAHQAQLRYGMLPEHAHALIEDDQVKARAQREMEEVTAGMMAPQAQDCSALVHMCLVKMGDLARCARYLLLHASAPR